MMIRGFLRAFSALMLALDRFKLGKETIKLETLVEIHIRPAPPTYPRSKIQFFY